MMSPARHSSREKQKTNTPPFLDVAVTSAPNPGQCLAHQEKVPSPTFKSAMLLGFFHSVQKIKSERDPCLHLLETDS